MLWPSLIVLVLLMTCCRQLGVGKDCAGHLISFKSLFPLAQDFALHHDPDYRLVEVMQIVPLSGCTNNTVDRVRFTFSVQRDGQCHDCFVEMGNQKEPPIIKEDIHACGPGDEFKENPIDTQQWAIDSVQAFQLAQKEGGKSLIAMYEDTKLWGIVWLNRDPSLQHNVWTILYRDLEREQLFIQLNADTGDLLERAP